MLFLYFLKYYLRLPQCYRWCIGLGSLLHSGMKVVSRKDIYVIDVVIF